MQAHLHWPNNNHINIMPKISIMIMMMIISWKRSTIFIALLSIRIYGILLIISDDHELRSIYFTPLTITISFPLTALIIIIIIIIIFAPVISTEQPDLSRTRVESGLSSRRQHENTLMQHKYLCLSYTCHHHLNANDMEIDKFRNAD